MLPIADTENSMTCKTRVVRAQLSSNKAVPRGLLSTEPALVVLSATNSPLTLLAA